MVGWPTESATGTGDTTQVGRSIGWAQRGKSAAQFLPIQPARTAISTSGRAGLFAPSCIHPRKILQNENERPLLSVTILLL